MNKSSERVEKIRKGLNELYSKRELPRISVYSKEIDKEGIEREIFEVEKEATSLGISLRCINSARVRVTEKDIEKIRKREANRSSYRLITSPYFSYNPFTELWREFRTFKIRKKLESLILRESKVLHNYIVCYI